MVGVSPRRPGRARLAVLIAAAVVVVGCGSGETTRGPTRDTALPFTIPGGTTGEYQETEVTVGSPPFELPGTLRVPDGATADDPVPGALVVGDFGPHDGDGTVLGRKPLRDLGEGLAGRGVATLTYEKRTFTYQDQLTDDPSVGLLDETIDDAVSALDTLRAADGVDPGQVFVVGHGFGGSVSPRIAEAGGGVAGLIAVAAPSRPMQRVLLDESRYLAEIDGEIDGEEQSGIDLVERQAARIDDPALSPDVVSGNALGASGLWWLDQRGYDPILGVDEASGPTFVILGGRDYRANEQDRARWDKLAADSPDVTVVVFDDLDHLLAAGTGPSSSDDYASAETVDSRLLDSIVSFIRSP
jgi:dienelactone hydrolase